mgnify:FL=1|jgi:hypothetical protein
MPGGPEEAAGTARGGGYGGDGGWRDSVGRALDTVTRTIDSNLRWFRGGATVACAATAILMVSKIKGMRMYKCARQIPREIFLGKMQIQGHIVAVPPRAGVGTLRFRHRPLGGSILRGFFSSPFAPSSSSDADDSIADTIRVRPFGVALPDGVNASDFLTMELVKSQKMVTLTPLCLATLEGDLVDVDDVDLLDGADEEVICICQMHARIGRGSVFSRLFNYRPYVDVAPTLLTGGLAYCLEEDQRVMLACGGLAALEPLMHAEHVARTAGLGLWAEDEEEIEGSLSSPLSSAGSGRGGFLSRLRRKITSFN